MAQWEVVWEVPSGVPEAAAWVVPPELWEAAEEGPSEAPSGLWGRRDPWMDLEALEEQRL